MWLQVKLYDQRCGVAELAGELTRSLDRVSTSITCAQCRGLYLNSLAQEPKTG